MKASTILSLTALLGFAAATPIFPRQNTTVGDVIEDPFQDLIDALNALPYVAPVSVPVAKRAEGLRKRGSCNPTDAGNYPTVSPDTDTAFLASADFTAKANAATAPAGYFPVAGWKNLKASAIKASYFTYISDPGMGYSPATCAAKCATISGCVSFNICRLLSIASPSRR